MTLQFDIHAAGALAPGVGSLADLLALRRGEFVMTNTATALPSPQSLPANERRRASQVVRLTMACAEQVLRVSPFPVDSLRLVFASDEGTGEVCQQMLETLATTRQVSPLLFHNSVHNAPSGYFSIAYQSRQPATSVSLGKQSFAGGLLCAVSEALSSHQPVLLLCYDPAMTDPMHALLPVSSATACAWIITAGDGNVISTLALARFALTLRPADNDEDDLLPSWLPLAWTANSSALGLAALGLLDDKGAPGACDLRLGAQRMRLERLDGATAC